MLAYVYVVFMFDACCLFSMFSLQFVIYLLLMVVLTIALILAADTADPAHYEFSSIGALRGLCEAITIILYIYMVCRQIYTIRK